MFEGANGKTIKTDVRPQKNLAASQQPYEILGGLNKILTCFSHRKKGLRPLSTESLYGDDKLSITLIWTHSKS